VVEDVDYRTPRRLDKALFQQLTTSRWIAEHRNLLLTGPCGIGRVVEARGCARAPHYGRLVRRSDRVGSRLDGPRPNAGLDLTDGPPGERSGIAVRRDQAAMVFCLVIGMASRKVCIGVFPKHHRP
jgi:IstB-like ATP binding protein